MKKVPLAFLYNVSAGIRIDLTLLESNYVLIIYKPALIWLLCLLFLELKALCIKLVSF